MYNRYIRQNDGTHRRNTMPDPVKPHPKSRPARQEESCSTPPPPRREPAPPARQRPCPARQDGSALGFLKNLLPGDFDTGDLMIVLLLILMAGDCQEDQNWAWLTLALYLFL